MSSAKLTLIGMYNYACSIGSDLFEGLNIPDQLDKETLINNILLQAADFEVLYADPDFLKTAIKIWSDREQPTFKRWADALAIEYAPLENYDRFEDWSDRENGSGSASTETDEDTTNNRTITTDVSAYDSSGYQPKEKVTDNASGSLNSTVDNTNSYNNSGTHSGRIHGNIGVTSSQQLLSDELQLGYWNIYSRITDLFLNEFCILVYT